MTEETKESLGQSLRFGAYWGLVSTILRLILTDVFALSIPVAFSLAMLITSLGVYPLFDRGTKIRRKFWFMKAERFNFWDHVVLSLILSVVAYLIARMFQWK